LNTWFTMKEMIRQVGGEAYGSLSIKADAVSSLRTEDN